MEIKTEIKIETGHVMEDFVAYYLRFEPEGSKRPKEDLHRQYEESLDHLFRLFVLRHKDFSDGDVQLVIRFYQAFCPAAVDGLEEDHPILKRFEKLKYKNVD